MTVAAQTAPNLERATFARRTAALLIDLLLVLVLTLFCLALLQGAAPDSDVRLTDLAQIVPWLIYTATEIFLAATLGKFLVGLRIGGQSGLDASRWTLFLRWSTKQYPWIVALVAVALPNTAWVELRGIVSIFLLIGCVAALDDDRLSWHDQWAGTAVWRISGRR